MISARLIALVASLLLIAALPAFAGQGKIAPGNAEIQYLSGGVGEENMAEMVAQEANYNFKALFVRDPNGEYLAGVNVVLTDDRANKLVELSTEGPVLLLELAQGKYTLTATTQADNKTIIRRLKISPNRPLTVETFRFPALPEPPL